MPDQYDDMAYLGKMAADGYEPGMEAPAWEKVLGRLEEEMPVRKRKLWVFWWVLPVLLLPVVLKEGKVFRGQDGVANKESRGFTQEKVEGFVKEKEEFIARNERLLPASSLAVSQTQREKKNYNSVQELDPPVSTQQQQDRIPAADKKNAESGFQPSVTPVQHTIQYQNTPQNNNFSANTEEAQTLRRSVAKYEAIANNPNTTLAATNQQFTQVSIPPRFTQKVFEQKKYEIAGNPSDSNTVSLIRKQTAMPNRWEVTLVTGADLSSDGLTRKDNAGWNLGIMAGYNISTHWTIRTGLIRTKKNYTVNGDQYDFKYASAYPNHKLTTVSGDCAMWEIPLNVRWMARPESKISPFLSGGLSTYLMTKERYTYSFTNAYDTLLRNRNYNETKTYPLGVVHLSAGLHTRINNKLSVSIEPFAKIPLQGLGSGNLRLMSLGGYGMVHWRF
ncbi:outer membrane beta-barrel protein [Parasegetibacter sp. NRK P23]|uniref:outer membrane beta-barrel protein n=1 Tax=Parasegetibacter sp. NRK P23 TaxID=2942999 RepID=UPI002043128F|nr:outer membrane beta-barrel protein [Parasegetibacter sp. NRK P23]MCM5528117.1 PorT family protein [Parasegetibacter sp. NRK P23]